MKHYIIATTATVALFFATSAAANCPYCNTGSGSTGFSRLLTLGKFSLSESSPTSKEVSLTYELNRPGPSNRPDPTVSVLYQEIIVIAHTKVVDAKACLPSVVVEWNNGSTFGTVGNMGVTYGGRMRVNASQMRLRLEKSCGYPMEYTIVGGANKNLTNNSLFGM